MGTFPVDGPALANVPGPQRLQAADGPDAVSRNWTSCAWRAILRCGWLTATESAIGSPDEAATCAHYVIDARPGLGRAIRRSALLENT
jgi:hypothetical protein